MWTVSSLLLMLRYFAFVKSVQLSCKEFILTTAYAPSKTCCQINENLVIFKKDDQISTTNGTQDCLQFKNKIIQQMPRNIGIIRQNLRFLEISNSKMREISSESLKSYKNLRYLNLEGNKLRVLGENLFKHNQQLEQINLNNNQIYLVASSTFSGLNWLSILDLKENICISQSTNNLNEIKLLNKSFANLCNVNNHIPAIISMLNADIVDIEHKIYKNISISNDEKHLVLKKEIKAILIKTETFARTFENTCSNLEEDRKKIKKSLNDVLNQESKLLKNISSLENWISDKQKINLTALLEDNKKIKFGYFEKRFENISSQILIFKKEIDKNSGLFNELDKKFNKVEKELNTNIKRNLQNFTNINKNFVEKTTLTLQKISKTLTELNEFKKKSSDEIENCKKYNIKLNESFIRFISNCTMSNPTMKKISDIEKLCSDYIKWIMILASLNVLLLIFLISSIAYIFLSKRLKCNFKIQETLTTVASNYEKIIENEKSDEINLEPIYASADYLSTTITTKHETNEEYAEIQRLDDDNDNVASYSNSEDFYSECNHDNDSTRMINSEQFNENSQVYAVFSKV